MADTPEQLSPVEKIKVDSQYLKGSLPEILAQDTTHVTEEEYQLLKFHGTYQQDDRDLRKQLVRDKKEKAYSFMVRTKTPGGKLSAEQYLVIDELSSKYGNGTLRITDRQGIQFHGILKKNIKALFRTLNESLITTLGACGDVVRNVMACPAPFKNRKNSELQRHAQEVSDKFLPQSGTYHEIWMDGEKVTGLDKKSPEEVEPIYGKTYLPRKFKIAIAFSDDNCVDCLAMDIGIVPELEGEKLKGFNIFVGGGFGMHHGNPKTFPRLASPLCFVTPAELHDIAEAIVLVQRDNGNRADRKNARMKYLIDKKGMDWFRQEVEKRFGKKTEPAHPVKFKSIDLHLGWNEQGDGKWFYGLSIENGRVKDEGDFRLKTAIRTVAEKYKPEIYLTAQHDILFSNIEENQKKEIEKIFTSHGVTLPEDLSLIQKESMACPALPTCGLALAESERVLPEMIDQAEELMKELGLEEQHLSLRMTGCPNGCARPLNSEVGLVGRMPGKYVMRVGGSSVGDRLNFEISDRATQEEVLKYLRILLVQFKSEKQKDEGFGDFCNRLGKEKITSLIASS